MALDNRAQTQGRVTRTGRPEFTDTRADLTETDYVTGFAAVASPKLRGYVRKGRAAYLQGRS